MLEWCIETSALPQFLCCIILTPPTQHLYLEEAGMWCLTITESGRVSHWVRGFLGEQVFNAQSSVKHACYCEGLGAWSPGKFWVLREYLNNYSYFIVIKSSNYLKFNMDIITNSVWVGDCSIRISECAIRIFRFFAANNGGWGRRSCAHFAAPGSTLGLSNYCSARISVYVFNSANAAVRNMHQLP